MLNKDLDKLIDEFMDANDNEVSINDAAPYFYELGKKDMKEQMGEQARKELAKTDITLADLVAFDEGLKLGRRLERQDRLTELDKSYKQAKRELEWFKEGKRQGREQMMKDAVEGIVICNEKTFGYKDILMEIPDTLDAGDKVKIVIIPERRTRNESTRCYIPRRIGQSERRSVIQFRQRKSIQDAHKYSLHPQGGSAGVGEGASRRRTARFIHLVLLSNIH